MRRLAANAAWLLLACVPMTVGRSAEMPLAMGVGDGVDARLAMHFEVTFMKIDVADIEAWLPPPTAARVAEVIATEENEGEARDLIAAEVLAADTLLISMEYARDSNHGRLMKGVRNGFQAARKSELVTEAWMEQMYGEMAPIFDPLVERGVLEGDRLVYRIDGDQLRVLYVDPAGTTLVESTFSGPEWTIGAKGAFFGEKSRFRKKLVQSVLDRES